MNADDLLDAPSAGDNEYACSEAGDSLLDSDEDEVEDQPNSLTESTPSHSSPLTTGQEEPKSSIWSCIGTPSPTPQKTPLCGVSERSRVIRLDGQKKFRFVADSLPDVPLPKRAVSRKKQTFCKPHRITRPSLLLEPKGLVVSAADLRNTLVANRMNQLRDSGLAADGSRKLHTSCSESSQRATNREPQPQRATNREAEPHPQRATNRGPQPQRATNSEPQPQRATNRGPQPQRATNREAEPQPQRATNSEPQPQRPQRATNREAEPHPQRATNRGPQPQRATNREPQPQRATNREAEPHPQRATNREPQPQRAANREPQPQRDANREPQPLINNPFYAKMQEHTSCPCNPFFSAIQRQRDDIQQPSDLFSFSLAQITSN